MEVLVLTNDNFLLKIKEIANDNLNDILSETMIFHDFERDVFPLLKKARNVEGLLDILEESYLYNYLTLDNVLILTMIFSAKHDNVKIINFLKKIMFSDESPELFSQIALYYGSLNAFIALEQNFNVEINPENLTYLRFAIYSENYNLIKYFVRKYISFRLFPSELFFYPKESEFSINYITERMFNFLTKLNLLEEKDDIDLFIDRFMNFDVSVAKDILNNSFPDGENRELFKITLQEKLQVLKIENEKIDRDDDICKINSLLKYI